MIFLALDNVSAEQHIYNVVSKIKPSHLQDALLVLPFERVTQLFTFLDIWASKEWNIPLTSRIFFFLLKTHHSQIVASKTMKLTLDAVRGHLRRALQRQKDEMGFNLAAMRYIKGEIEER